LAYRLIYNIQTIGFPEAKMQGLSIAAKTTSIIPRRSQRRSLVLPGRITWKDARGTMRFASVLTRDVSETGIFIEWNEPTSIPLYRLVTFQLERDSRNVDGLPAALRSGKVLSAVYRAGTFQKSTGAPDGYGLRLLVEPAMRANAAAGRVEATA
jgi:hypothetical protein